MADVAQAIRGSATAGGTGPFGRLARAQYGALAAMRARLFVNSLRSNEGVFELGARTVAYVVYGSMGLGMGVGAGAVTYSLISRAEWRFVPIAFWIVCFLWQSVSIALASFQEQYDLSSLLRFPVNFSSYYVLFLLFGLIDASTILGAMCCTGLLIGISMARSELFGWAVLGLSFFAAFNILLARAILAWVDRWLAKRRSREIVTVIFVLAVLSLQLLNPALHQRRYEDVQEDQPAAARHMYASGPLWPYLEKVNVLQVWLPPGSATAMLRAAARKHSERGFAFAGLIAIYTFAAGGLLALRLRAEFRGENLGEAPERTKVEAQDAAGLLSGGGPISAVIEKELQTFRRSTPQLFSVAVPMLMVFVIGSLFRNNGLVNQHPMPMALPICVAYGLLGFTQLMYNSLGTEGRGIQMLFLSPVPIRTVLLGKNLFHALLYVLVALIAGFLAVLRLGLPEGAVLVATLGWLVFALPANLAAGNVLSLTMAYRINPGRIGRQSGSQANALLSMLIQMTVLGVGAGVIALCSIYQSEWLIGPILFLFAGIAFYVWRKILDNVDAMANQRRDVLIAKLAKIE